MLTDSEREWLERRRLFDGVNRWSHYSCRSCEHYAVGRWEGYHYPCGVSVFGGCPKVNPDRYDMQEAAEFESRVAAKLAENAYRKVVLVEGDISDFGLLKWARLQVEEEIDAEMDN